MKQDEKNDSGERRRDHHASQIADVLGAVGVHAAPADCSEGVVCVGIFHHGKPDRDARGAIETTEKGDEGPVWEEKLWYQGAQIPHAIAESQRLALAHYDRERALAVMRGAQDVADWL